MERGVAVHGLQQAEGRHVGHVEVQDDAVAGAAAASVAAASSGPAAVTTSTVAVEVAQVVGVGQVGHDALGDQRQQPAGRSSITRSRRCCGTAGAADTAVPAATASGSDAGGRVDRLLREVGRRDRQVEREDAALARGCSRAVMAPPSR